MSTNHTSNYQLSQWVKSDQVKMEDFNADNAKIDAALASKASVTAVNGKADKSALSALQSTVSGQSTALGLRNCRFVTGAYTGTGKYGAANANTLTFPQKPVFLRVVSDSSGAALDLIAGQTFAFVSSGSSSTMTVTWGSRSVSWYVENPSSTSSAPGHQMNAASLYHYFAILEI